MLAALFEAVRIAVLFVGLMLLAGVCHAERLKALDRSESSTTSLCEESWRTFSGPEGSRA